MSKYGDWNTALSFVGNSANTLSNLIMMQKQSEQQQAQFDREMKLREEAARQQAEQRQADMAFRQAEQDQTMKDREYGYRQNFADSSTLADLISRNQPDNQAWKGINNNMEQMRGALNPTMIPAGPSSVFDTGGGGGGGGGGTFSDWNAWDKPQVQAQPQQEMIQAPGPYIANAPYPYTALRDNPNFQATPSPGLLSGVYNSLERDRQAKDMMTFENNLPMTERERAQIQSKSEEDRMRAALAGLKPKPLSQEEKKAENDRKEARSTYLRWAGDWQRLQALKANPMSDQNQIKNQEEVQKRFGKGFYDRAVETGNKDLGDFLPNIGAIQEAAALPQVEQPKASLMQSAQELGGEVMGWAGSIPNQLANTRIVKSVTGDLSREAIANKRAQEQPTKQVQSPTNELTPEQKKIIDNIIIEYPNASNAEKKAIFLQRIKKG